MIKSSERTTWIGAAAMLGAAALMTPGLWAFSMWIDELNMLETALRLKLNDVSTWTGYGHPPLYFLLLKGWILAAGQSDFALRAASLFAAMIAAALVFRIAVDLTVASPTLFERRTTLSTNPPSSLPAFGRERGTGGEAIAGAAAALIFAALMFIRYYVHQTHNYAMFLMMSMALLLIYERWWRTSTPPPNPPPDLTGVTSRRRRFYSIAGVLATAGLVYTHYYGMFLILALDLHAAIMGLRRPRETLRWALVQIVAVLLVVPWIPTMIETGQARLNNPVYAAQGGITTGQPTNLATILKTFHTMLGGQEWLFILLLVIGAAAFWWTGINRPLRGRSHASNSLNLNSFLLIGVAFLGSLALALGVNLTFKTFLDRRVIYLLPLLAILIGMLLAYLPKAWMQGAVLLIAVPLIRAVPPTDTLPGDWGFRRAVSIVAQNAHRGDLVVLQFRDADAFQGREMRYYTDQLLPDERIISLGEITLDRTDNQQHFANQVVRPWVLTRQSFWLIRSQEADLGDTSTEWVDRITNRQFNFREQEHYEIGWIVISRYEAPYMDRPATPDKAVQCDPDLPLVFGGIIQLDQCALSEVEVPAGESISLWLEWHARANIAPDAALYLHLLKDEAAAPVAQIDEPPNHLGEPLPTFFWGIDGPVYDQHALPLSAGIPPGDYLLKLGLYDRVTGQRLPVTLPDGSVNDGVILAKIHVLPQP